MKRIRGYEVHLEQGSAEWLRWRADGIGGSESAVIKMGGDYPFSETPYTLWQRKIGAASAPVFNEKQQAAMQRGHDLEPVARDLFIRQTGIVVEPVCMVHAYYPFVRASMDGMNRERDVLVEIKAPGERIWKKILEEGIPDYYYVQVQHQLAVTGAREAYFWAYTDDPAYAGQNTYLERIVPDDAFIEDLLIRLKEFWRSVETGLPPVESVRDRKVGVVAISGYAGTGKDTVGRVIENVFDIPRFAFGDRVKAVTVALGLAKGGGGERNKAKDRDAYITLAQTMREVYPQIWIEPVIDLRSDFRRIARERGAFVTDVRFLNELSALRRECDALEIPLRHWWIERPGVGPYSEIEATTTRHLRGIADRILYNDVTVDPVSQSDLLERFVLDAFQPDRKEVRLRDYR